MADAAAPRATAATDAPLGPESRRLELRAADGVRLRGAVIEGGGRGHVLLLHGRTEHLEKYGEVVPELTRRGFGVASLDWRGQGGSARLTTDPRMGHVEDFADYQIDLETLLAAPEVAALPAPRVVVAHSMGGCVAMRALASGALRTGVAGAVFSAPMWGLAGGAGRFGGVIAALACALGLGRRYVRGAGPTPYALTPFEDNLLTSDPEAHARLAALAREHPDYGLGGPSWGWLRAASREMRALRDARLALPALVLLGDDEAVVSSDAVRARVARDGLDLAELPAARHELFFETAAVRAEIWRSFDRFLAKIGV